MIPSSRNGFVQSRSPIIVWIIGLILLLLPNLVLWIADKTSQIGIGEALLIPLSLYILLFTLSRSSWKVMLWLIPLFILNGAQLVLLYLLGDGVISASMILNMVTTNGKESVELFSGILLPFLVAVLFYLVLPISVSWYSKGRKELLSKSVRGKLQWGAAVLLLSGLTVSYVSYPTKKGFLETVYPINVGTNAAAAVRQIARLEDYPRQTNHFSFLVNKKHQSEKREIYLFVLGETSRAANWQLYGYERMTNPLLSQRENLVTCSRVMTLANFTHRIVPLILTSAEADDVTPVYTQPSFIKAFRESGFYTCYLSNQSTDRTFIEYYKNEADTLIQLSSVGDRYPYDEELLPHLENIINQTTGNLLVVMHTYGSHYGYSERYPRSFAHFQPDMYPRLSIKYKDSIVNAYDNTIRYTDYVLDQSIRLLEKSGASSIMLYSSDHGEDLMDDERQMILHCSPIPTYYQLHVPMIFWYSDQYAHENEHKVNAVVQNARSLMTTSVIFHSMLDVASISTPYLKENYSIANNHFKAQTPLFVNDHDNAVALPDLGLSQNDWKHLEALKISRSKMAVNPFKRDHLLLFKKQYNWQMITISSDIPVSTETTFRITP